MSKKIGFWAVFAIVTGSQIGSGIFMLPASLAPYGYFSIYGWLLSALGAICLSLVFSGLCQRFPRTGGPHVYVNEMFGKTASFFTGWTYWVISWVSTTAVIIASISYLSPFIGSPSSMVYLLLELMLLISITLLNLKGIKSAGKAEFLLTVIKIIPLLLLPLVALRYFKSEYFMMTPEVTSLPVSGKLAHVVLLTLWGFIGLETATTPAGSVSQPSKTIPRAIVLGTICSAILYLISSIGIMGLIPGETLASSKAPYVIATQHLFGGNWHLWIALIASVVCIGTLNAWMLTSGQIALGLSEDQLMPKWFASKNRAGAPSVGLVISCLGIIPLLFLTLNSSIANQITTIIDFSVIAFLFVYMISVLAYLKVLYRERAKYYHWIYSLGALFFCVWVVSQTPCRTILISLGFVLSGVPMYALWFCKKHTSKFSALIGRKIFSP